MAESDSRVHTLRQSNQLLTAMTIIRNEGTSREDFIFHSQRITRLLIDETLNLLPYSSKIVTTPTGTLYHGIEPQGKICGISIMRAGESMEGALRDCCSSIRIGKILIQRDEETCRPKLFYSKFPTDVASRTCLLLDPMLATGGSAIKAIEVLIASGVSEAKIMFVNIVACQDGIDAMLAKFPAITIITACVDPILNAKNFIVPGLGDFGCRYFGTD